MARYNTGTMTAVAISHIVIDDHGAARVAGTRSSVDNIVMDTMNGLTVADIHREYPHLSLSQIHAELAYYYDHKAEIDSYIERTDRECTAMWDEAIRSGKHLSRAE